MTAEMIGNLPILVKVVLESCFSDLHKTPGCLYWDEKKETALREDIYFKTVITSTQHNLKTVWLERQ